MPYEQLIAALLEEGEGKCSEVRRKARTEADRLWTQAQAAAADLEREAEAKVRQAVATHRNEILSRATLLSRQILLQAKHEVLESLWERARERSTALSGEARSWVLRALLDELLTSAPSGPRRAMIHRDDRSRLESNLTKLGIPFEVRQREDLALGIEIDVQGEILRSSLATRLAKAKPTLLIELNELLFRHPSSDTRSPLTETG